MARLESPVSLFHIMAHSIEGKYLFLDDQDRNEFLSRFAKGLTGSDFQCYAWTLMDDHYHIFIKTSHLPLSKLMRALNSGYARYYNKKYGRRGYLFQDRFQSVLCQDQDYAVQLIKYIHLNPLRAGKVQSLEQLKDWVWCGHGFLLGPKNAMGEKFQNRLECLRRFGDNETDAVKGYLQSLEQSCLGDDNKTAGKLPFKEAYEISGSCKGWPAVIGDSDFAKNAMEKYSRLCFQRKHRKADYTYVLDTISNKICTEYGITHDDLFKRGRKNKLSLARADFCYQSHLKELIPLSVIAGFLRTTISPIALLVKKGDPISKSGLKMQIT
jgi:REP element-mobilizing transposase RayT